MRERDIEKFVENARVLKGPNEGNLISDNSQRLHRKNIRIYFEWLQDEEFENWYDIRPSDIGSYIRHREKDNGSRGADIAQHIASLKRFYAYLGQDFPDQNNPVRAHLRTTSYTSGRTAREEEGYDTGVTDEEFQQLLDNVGKRHAERDRLILKFMGRLGLRRSEAVELKTDDVNIETRRIDVPGTKSSPRPIKFWSNLKPDIRRWLEGGQREGYQHAFDSDYLFLSERSGSITPKAVNKMVKKTAERAGIQETMYRDASDNKRHRITAHQLRHYFGNKMFRDDTMSLKALSEYMGHSSVDITADRYGQMTEDEKFEMFDDQIA